MNTPKYLKSDTQCKGWPWQVVILAQVTLWRWPIRMQDYINIVRPHRCAIRPVVANTSRSVCPCVCWSRAWPLQKRLNRSRCRLGVDSAFIGSACWSKLYSRWRRWRIVHCMAPHHLTWRRHSHASPTCRAYAGSGPPPLNSLTFRPVVGQLSEVVPFLLLEQRCGMACQATLRRPRRCRCSRTGWRHTCSAAATKLFDSDCISFSSSLSHLENSGPCNSFHCLGHSKNVYDDDDDDPRNKCGPESPTG